MLSSFACDHQILPFLQIVRRNFRFLEISVSDFENGFNIADWDREFNFAQNIHTKINTFYISTSKRPAATIFRTQVHLDELAQLKLREYWSTSSQQELCLIIRVMWSRWNQLRSCWFEKSWWRQAIKTMWLSKGVRKSAR